MPLAAKLQQSERLNRGFHILQFESKNKVIAVRAIVRILTVITALRRSSARLIIVLATLAALPVFSGSNVPGEDCDFGKVSTAVTVDEVYGHTRRALSKLNIAPSDWDDIMQEVMILYLTKGQQFEGRNDAKLSTWIFVVTRNASASSYRKRRDKTTLDASEDGEDSAAKRVESKTPQPDRAVELDEYGRTVVPLIRQAIRELPIERREVILALATGIRQEEVAKQLEIDFGTVKSRLYRTAGQLREKLNQLGMKDVNPDLKASDIAELEIWKLKEFPINRTPKTADDVLGQMPPVTRDILALHLLYDLPPASIGKIMRQKAKQITRYLEGMKLRLAEQAGAHSIKLPDEWNIPSVHYSKLEDTVDAIRAEHERALVSRVLLKSENSKNAAAALGIEEQKAREILSRNMTAIRRRARLFKIEDPRLSPKKQTQARTLEEAIASLPQIYRPIMRAKLVDGLHNDVDAIAAQTGLSNSDVNAKTAKAKKILAKILEENSIVDPRSGHIYSPASKTMAEAIWKVAPNHQPILKLLHIQLLQADQIRELPEYQNSKTFARDLRRAQEALTKVLEEQGLENLEQQTKLARILKRREARRKHIERISEKMEPLTRDILRRSEIENHPIEQIASELGKTTNEVALILSDARLASFSQLTDPKHIKRKIALLPPSFRKAAELHFIDGKTRHDTATALSADEPLSMAQKRMQMAARSIGFANRFLPSAIKAIEDPTSRQIAQLRWLDGYTREEIAGLVGKLSQQVEDSLTDSARKIEFRFALTQIEEGRRPTKNFPLVLRTSGASDERVSLPAYELQILTRLYQNVTKLNPDSAEYTQAFENARLERDAEGDKLKDQITVFVPEKYQAAARLALLEGFSRQQIASRLGISQTMAKHWKQKALGAIDESSEAPALVKERREQERANLVAKIETSIPAEFQEAARLMLLEKLSVSEISRRLGIGRQAVHNLHEEIQGFMQDEGSGQTWVQAKQNRELERLSYPAKIEKFVPEKYKEAARLLFVEGSSLSETAEKVGINRRNVKIWKNRIKAAIKDGEAREAKESTDPTQPSS